MFTSALDNSSRPMIYKTCHIPSYFISSQSRFDFFLLSLQPLCATFMEPFTFHVVFLPVEQTLDIL